MENTLIEPPFVNLVGLVVLVGLVGLVGGLGLVGLLAWCAGKLWTRWAWDRADRMCDAIDVWRAMKRWGVPYQVRKLALARQLGPRVCTQVVAWVHRGSQPS